MPTAISEAPQLPLSEIFEKYGRIYVYNFNRDVPHISIEISHLDPRLLEYSGTINRHRWVCRTIRPMRTFLQKYGRGHPRTSVALAFLKKKDMPYTICHRLKYTPEQRAELVALAHAVDDAPLRPSLALSSAQLTP